MAQLLLFTHSFGTENVRIRAFFLTVDSVRILLEKNPDSEQNLESGSESFRIRNTGMQRLYDITSA